MSAASEFRLEVPRTARIHRAGSAAPADLWYVLHGYGQLAGDFVRVFEGVLGPEAGVVAPEALSRFYPRPSDSAHGPSDPVGASWMTREDRLTEIDDYVRYLDLVVGAAEKSESPARSRTLLGFSQGVHTAARWICFGTRSPRSLIAWGAPLPPDLPLERFRVRLDGAPMTLVTGEADGAFGPSAAEREAARLVEAGLKVKVRTHAGGHRLSRALLRELMPGAASPA